MNRLPLDVGAPTVPLPAWATFLRAQAAPLEAAALQELGTRAAFVGAPVETHGFPVRPGTTLGPAALRTASFQYAAATLIEYAIDLREYWRLVDCGDIAQLGSDTARFHSLIRDALTTVMGAGAIPIMCGGDHSIPIPGVAALCDVVDGKVGYLHIDAHLDIAEEICGDALTMQSPVARAVENPKVDPKNVVVFGARGGSYTPAELDTARSMDITIFPMAQILARDFASAVEDALDAVWSGVDAVYVSFDNDSMDAAYAPGTTGPEPYGFTPREMVALATAVGRRGVAVLDIAELSPNYDPAGITARLDCCWVLYVLSAYARALDEGSALPPVYAR